VQVTQLLCALALWLLIWRVAPFRPYEKLLLLLSYFLFWEYFIVSRPYALMKLLGFGFIALRANRPERRIWPWLLLGPSRQYHSVRRHLVDRSCRLLPLPGAAAMEIDAFRRRAVDRDDGAARRLRAPSFGTAARFQPVPDAVALRRLRLLKQFPSAIVSDEVFTIYQLRAKPD
jgi:hypothetical protein